VREEECTAIAREIHDVLAQELTRLKIDLVWLAKRLARPVEEPARATIAEPTEPLPPVRLSTITVLPMASDSKGAITRAAMSVGPPAENGTTKRTVLFCAKLPNVVNSKLAATAM
jgi:hypothetical protein